MHKLTAVSVPLRAALAMLALSGCGGGSSGASAGTASGPTPTPTPTATATTTATAPAPVAAIAFAATMSPGWNLGNSLEAIGSMPRPANVSQETAWGNAPVTQAMLNAVAAAGFKSVRIPLAWSQYADSRDVIGTAWMNRVAEVVDYARNAGLKVVINVHWDGGWLQPTYAAQAVANARLATFWTQIATRFRDYDDNLLFAGTNEIAVTDVYTAPTAENCAVQKGFNQKFVDTVRATGGRNATRFLVVQAYNTNIDSALSCNATMPGDTAAGRMMMEVHYYDPFDFTLNEKSDIWQWGATATDPAKTQTWANEAYTDAQFQKVKVTFVDKGIPVLLGEYSAIAKTDFDPTGTYRTRWDRYITASSVRHGLVPIYWDNGVIANRGSGLFDRANATPAYPDVIAAVIAGAKEGAQP